MTIDLLGASCQRHRRLSICLADAACHTVVVPDLVRVLSTASVPEGEIAKARLEDEGIPVLLKGEGTGPYRMGPVHLYVTADVEVQARLVLEATLAPGGDVPRRDEAEETEPS